jgi:outer membrane protein assembly factor BamB
MLSSVSRRTAAGFVALFAVAACAPEPPPQNPTGRTVQPLWHVVPYAIDRTPILANELVFAVATPSGRARSHAYAFDRKDGSLRWASAFAADRILGVIGGLIYVREAGANLDVALDATGGTARPFHERRSLGTMTASPGGGFYAVAGAATLVSATAAGETRWQHVLPVDIDTEHAPVLANGTVAVFGSREDDDGKALHGVYAFDATSGALRWEAESTSAYGSSTSYDARSIAGDARNVYADYFVQAPGRSYRLLVARDAATGAERWRRERFVSCADEPTIVAPNRILACVGASGSGGLYAELDGATGAIDRKIRTADFYGGGVVRDGSLFTCGSSRYRMLDEGGSYSYYRWLTRVDLRTGRELWRGPVQTAAEFTAPVASHGLVVLGSKADAGMGTGNGPIDGGSPDVAGLWAWRYASDSKATGR